MTPDLDNWNAAATDGTGRGSVNAPTPINRISADELLGSLDGAPAATPAGDQGRFPLVNPYQVEGRMRTAEQGVQGALTNQTQFLDRLDENIAETQAQRRARLEQSVATRTKLNDIQEAETHSMIEHVAPIISDRNATSKQLEHLATMNPLARGIRGIFDLNYNQRYLQERQTNLDHILASRGQDYEFMSGLRERLVRSMDAADAGQASLEDLRFHELDETGRALGMQLQGSEQQFGHIADVVNRDRELRIAQVQATDQFLSEQPPARLSQLEGMAQRAPNGMVTVDGVQMHIGEIHQRRVAAEAQDLSLESAHMAVESGRMELADRHATEWARNATQTQIQAAISNGGRTPNGIRIPQDVLTGQLQNRLQRNEMIASTSADTSPLHTLTTNIHGFLNDRRIISERMTSINGTPPREFIALQRDYMAEMDGIVTQLEHANQAGLPEVARALNQRLSALRQGFGEGVNRIARSMVGGDQTAANWMGSYLRGEELDPSAAADAMVYYARRGSLPAGMRASPQARSAFQAAQSAIHEVDADADRRHIPQSERQDLYRQRVQSTIPGSYTSGTFNEFISALPEIAHRVNSPFAGVTQQDFQAARRAADTIPYQEIGTTLGISAQDARLLFSGQYRGANAATLNQAVQQQNLRGQLLARQQGVFADYLDRSPSARPGFRPSRALAELLQTPAVHNFADNMDRLSRSSSYGDYMAGSMSQGALTESFGQWSQHYNNQVDDIRVAEIASSSTRRALYNTNPALRAQVILAAIPGLSQVEEAQLMHALQPHIGAVIDVNDPAAAAAMSGTGDPIPEFSRSGGDPVRDVLARAHFQDRNLERIRRIAAENWEAAAQSTDGAIDAYNGERHR